MLGHICVRFDDILNVNRMSETQVYWGRNPVVNCEIEFVLIPMYWPREVVKTPSNYSYDRNVRACSAGGGDRMCGCY